MTRNHMLSLLLAGSLALTGCFGGKAASGGSAASSGSASAAQMASSGISSSPAVERRSAATFADVPEGAWYAEAVAWCQEQGLMTGTQAGVFSPDGTLSRSMLAAVLHRMAGAPEAETRAAFSDTDPDGWYASSLSWAVETGVMTGYGDGTFGPEDPVTREQVATVLWRQAGSPDAAGDAGFADEASLSSWARTAASWAKGAGVMDGRDGNRMEPRASMTRAEAAMALRRFAQRDETQQHLPYDGVYPQHEPYGTGVGVMPGRVVWTHDPESVSWDGEGYWWRPEHFDAPRILDMVRKGIASLAGEEDVSAGWAALFAGNRASRGLSGGYAAGQKIAIKVNINGSAVMDDDTSGETKMSYTNPVLLQALLRSLVEDVGVAPGDITVYDVSRLFPDYMVEMCTEGSLQGIRFVDRETGVADQEAPIRWSHEFSGAVNYLPTCVTEAEYVINFANLKGHSYGITLCGKNHFGSFINGNLMRPPEGANLHQWLTHNEMGIYSPLVDLMANADLGGKTVLYLLDALICAPSEGASITGDNSRWQQAPFNGDYTSSVFFSQDPVAIDSVGADFLMAEPAVTEHNGILRNNPTVENYLHEAGLVAHAPSGTVYTDSQGHEVANLGVHEHWNNSTEKLYGRNLGKAEGIELVRIGE